MLFVLQITCQLADFPWTGWQILLGINKYFLSRVVVAAAARGNIVSAIL
jgi:hypothetical protein